MKIYRFNELSDASKQYAIDQNRDWNVSDSFWSASILDVWQNALDVIGFNGAKIYFSGFHSQGNGACFECDYVDFPVLFDFIMGKDSESDSIYAKAIQGIVHQLDHFTYDHQIEWIHSSDDCINEINVRLYRINHHYNHLNCVKVELHSCFPDSFQSALDDLEDTIQELYRELCCTIYHQLDVEYQCLTSDECVAESLIANEIEFLENGKIY